MIYLYGLLASDADMLPVDAFSCCDGVTGDVAVEPCAGHFLICGKHDGSEILPRRRLLLSHARVLEHAMECGTVLPMRFGMTCGSVLEFEKLVQGQTDAVKSALARLDGCVEIGVRVSGAEEAVLGRTLEVTPALLTERNRLRRTGARDHFAKAEFGRTLAEGVSERRGRAQKILLERLVAYAVDHVLKAPETEFEALRAEFLIAENRLDAFTTLLEETVVALDFAGAGGCSAHLVGPGPGFHFVDLNLAIDRAEAAA